MATRALAVLGRGIVPVDTPIALADDAGLTRGDGCFETIHVRDGGRPWQLKEHLDRMAGSAKILDIDLPPHDQLEALVEEVLTVFPTLTDQPDEGGVKLVCTRGPETGQDIKPLVFAMLIDVTPAQRQGRRDGINVYSVTTGMSADVRSQAPWLLGGAKTLSYAMNMAALRYSANKGGDDTLFLSADGIVLEAPTATVVWVSDGALRTTPNDTGILAGTTANYMLDHAGDVGLRAERKRITLEELYAADEAWLCSSVRGAARIMSIDDQPMRESGYTNKIQELLGFPV